MRVKCWYCEKEITETPVEITCDDGSPVPVHPGCVGGAKWKVEKLTNDWFAERDRSDQWHINHGYIKVPR